MDAVYRVMAIAQLRDLLSGPLRSIKGHLGSAKVAAAAFSASLARMAVVMAAVAAGAGMVVGMMVSLAMSTVETGRALGELRSVGVENLQALEDKATEVSNTWAGIAKVGFIKAAYDIKSGIASLSDEGVASFTEYAAITAKATKAATEQMTSLFATGYGIFKKTYSDMSDFQFGELFSSGIAASVQQFKTTGPNMGAALENLGALAANANIEFEEQLAILGMLQATMSGAEAGTKYKAFVTAAASAGEKLKLQFLDANKQLRSMPEILGELKKKYGEVIDQTEKLEIQKAFGSSEAVAVVDLLVNKTGELTSNIGALKDATGQGIEFTRQMAMTMNTDLGSAVDIMKQRWNNLIEIMGSPFTWSVRQVVWMISDLILEFQKLAKSWLSNPVGALLFKIAGGVAAAAAALAVLAVVGAALTFLWPILTAGLSAALGALGAVVWPLLLVAAVVGGLYAAWKTNFLGMRDVVTKWYNKTKLVVQAVIEIFQSLGKDGLGPTEGKISTKLAKQLDEAGLTQTVTRIAQVIYRLKELFAGLWTGFESSFGDIWAGLEPGIMALVEAFEPLGTCIRDVTSALTDAGAETDASTWRILGEAIGGGLGRALSFVATGLSLVIIGIVEVTKTMAGMAGSISAGDWEGAYQQLEELFEPLVLIARGAWEMFKEASVEAANDAWASITESCRLAAFGVWDAIGESFGGGKTLPEYLGGAWEEARTYLENLTLEDVATLPLDGLATTISVYTGLDRNLVKDKIKGPWEAARDYLENLTLEDVATLPLEGLLTTISVYTGMDRNLIKDKISGAWESVRVYLENLTLEDVATLPLDGLVTTISVYTGLDRNLVEEKIKGPWEAARAYLESLTLEDVATLALDGLVKTIFFYTGIDEDLIKNKISGAWESAKSFLKDFSLSDVATGVFDGYVTTISALTGMDPEEIKAKLTAFWDKIKAHLKTIDLGDIGREIIASMADGFKSGMRDTYNRMVGTVTDLKNWILNKKEPAPETGAESGIVNPAQIKSDMDKLQPLVVGPMTRLQDRVREFDVAGPVSDAVLGAEGALQGLNWASYGQAAMSTFADGVRNASPLLKAAMSDAISKTKPLMPQSDAAEGPFSRLTASGASIPATMAAGIRGNQGALKDALRGAFGGLDYPELSGIPLPRTDGETRMDPSDGGRAGSIRAGDDRSIVIQHLSVTLPDVQDADDFGRQLQRFVEQHDVED